MEEALIGLTENQTQLLRTIFEKGTIESGASGLKGHGLGRVASSLREQGFITPMGRAGRQYKWKLTSAWQENWINHGEEIRTILDQIVRGATMTFDTIEMSKVEFIKGALARLEDDVGTIFNYLDQHNRTHARQVGFWASIRLLMPPIEAIAEAVGEKPWEFLANHLDVTTPGLAWQMFRHSLIHGDLLGHALYGAKRVNWGVDLIGAGHIIRSGVLHLDTKYLYEKLTNYLKKEIAKNDQTLIRIRVGIIYQNPPQYIVEDFAKL